MKIPHLARAREEFDRRFPVGSLRARFAKGATWSLIGAVISQGLALVASVIVARLLGEVGFGELGMNKEDDQRVQPCLRTMHRNPAPAPECDLRCARRCTGGLHAFQRITKVHLLSSLCR